MFHSSRTLDLRIWRLYLKTLSANLKFQRKSDRCRTKVCTKQQWPMFNMKADLLNVLLFVLVIPRAPNFNVGWLCFALVQTFVRKMPAPICRRVGPTLKLGVRGERWKRELARCNHAGWCKLSSDSSSILHFTFDAQAHEGLEVRGGGSAGRLSPHVEYYNKQFSRGWATVHLLQNSSQTHATKTAKYTGHIFPLWVLSKVGEVCHCLIPN